MLRALPVAGRDVIVPANTFYATAAAVISAGGQAGVRRHRRRTTFALSPQTLAAALTPDTAAVVLVHIGGLITPAGQPSWPSCARPAGRCWSRTRPTRTAPRFGGRFAGSFGLAAAFSFYPTKVVTCGEGGMILTASDDLADEALIYRDQGKGSFGANHHVRHGYAWRISEQNAATGLVHLRRMTASIAPPPRSRRPVQRRAGGPVRVAAAGRAAGCVSNIYKYIAVLDPGIDRAWFKEQLATRHDVRLAGEVYDLPLHLQPILEEFALGQSLPVAEDACARHVCLPVHSDMGDDEIDQVLTAVTEVIGERACASR